MVKGSDDRIDRISLAIHLLFSNRCTAVLKVLLLCSHSIGKRGARASDIDLSRLGRLMVAASSSISFPTLAISILVVCETN